MRRVVRVSLLFGTLSCAEPDSSSGTEQAGADSTAAVEVVDSVVGSSAATVMSVEDSIPPSAPPADPIDSLDFNIAGLTQSTDSAEVRRILGAPDSIIVAPNPVGDGMLTSWAFPGLNVHYYGGNRVALVDVTGPDYSTRRGISVGDSAAHVLASYGPQEGDVPTNWVYAEPADMERLHLIHFYFSGDVVERIILGWALDRHMCPTATAVAHVV